MPCSWHCRVGDGAPGLKRAFKSAHTLVHAGDILLRLAVFPPLGQAADGGEVPPELVLHLSDTGVELLHLLDSVPDGSGLLPLDKAALPLLQQGL